MEFKVILFVLAMTGVLLVSGCTSPSPTATPQATTEVTPTPTPIANTSTPTPAPTEAPTVTPTPAPTALPVYANGSPVSVSNIKIDWDTNGYDGMARQTATMTVDNVNNETLTLDVVVLYKVTTPTTITNPDGSMQNLTNTITKRQDLGTMQWDDHKDLTFDVSHNKNVPVTVTIVVQWRGGQAVVFEKTLTMADHSLGTFEF